VRTAKHASRDPFRVLERRHGLARLPLRVVRAFLDSDRDGLLVFFVGMVLLCVAAAIYTMQNNTRTRYP
jgi:hypothetical protein